MRQPTPSQPARAAGDRNRPRRVRTARVALAIVAVIAAACGSSPTVAPSSSAAPSPVRTVDASPTATAGPSFEPATVRLALDWTPNTNHLGFFAARDDGTYERAGISLDVLPYTGTTPEALIAAGQAECGVSFQDALTFAAAAGAPVVSVMAILQHSASEIAVLADSAIRRPRDLDGTIYAGFGYPNEVPTVRAVIQNDGGRGIFDEVTLDSAAYEALYARRADMAIIFTAWEGIEARQRGIALRTFAFTEFGFPDFYQVVLACDSRWLAREPDVARRFVAATAHGFETANADPEAAADILIRSNRGVFDANRDLPIESARFLVDGGFLVDATGRAGHQTLQQWRGYSGFLYEAGLLTDADGRPLTAPPDYGALFTNEFLE